MSSFNKFIDNVNEIRKGNKYFITNAFFNFKQLQSMFDMNNVVLKIKKSVIFILLEEDNFIRLYYYAASLEELKEMLTLLPKHPNKTIIVEVVGKKNQIKNCINELEKLNFGMYSKLIRMKRLGQECKKIEISNVRAASEDRINEIINILYSEFDTFISHLPTKEKVLKSIKNNEIMVVIEQQKIVALAYFENIGDKLLYLYQLVVDKSSRGKGLADNLLMYKFQNLTKDVTCQLWVEECNQHARHKYAKFNFVPDGIVDYIMVYEGVRISG